MRLKYYALDLVDDPNLIKEYEDYHIQIWPEIEKSILDAGILNMQIFRTGNRLVMVMETTVNYDADVKKMADDANPKVQEWEQLMWKYQQALPWAQNGEKWIEMKNIFSLNANKDGQVK